MTIATPPTTDHRVLGTWTAVRLIAGREISTRLRSKAYLVTTVIMVAAIVLLNLIFALASGSSSATPVGVTDAALAAPLESAGEAVGEELAAEVVDAEDGRSRVEAGELAALVSGSDDGLAVVVETDLDSSLETALLALARELVLQEEINALGGDPASVNSALARATVDVTAIVPPFDYDGQQLVLGMITGILIYLALLITGQMVAQGVVEEKSSRVVELLLAAIRPWQLMAGKVAGIGVVGLTQVGAIALFGVGSALALDTLSIEISAALGTVIWLLVWFVLGFLMYALVFAAAGALVSRQEEVAGVVTPASMVIVAGYVVGISVLPAEPDNRVAEIMSLIPTFAPTLMPMRLAMGGVPAWQAALSVGLVLVLIPLLVWLSGRIYRNAVMRTGARVRLRDALREL